MDLKRPTKIHQSILRMQKAVARIRGEKKVSPPELPIVSSAVKKAVVTRICRELVGDISQSIEDTFYDELDSLKSKNVLEKQLSVQPENCRLLMENNSGGFLLIEEPPQIRTVLVTTEIEAYNEYKPEVYRLALPYQVFVFSFYKRKNKYYIGQVGLGFKDSRTKSLVDIIHEPCFPHCSLMGNCVGDNLDELGRDSLVELVQHYMEVFWGSPFIYPLRPFAVKIKGKNIEINSWKDWQDKIQNPLDTLKMTFQGASAIKDIIENFSYDFDGDGDSLQDDSFADFQVIVRNSLRKINKSIDSKTLAQKINTALDSVLKNS